MDDPFFAEDDGEFDDFYGNGVRKSSRPSQSAMPLPSESRTPAMHKEASLVYPDTPASSVASFMSRSTDGGMLSVSTVTTPHHGSGGGALNDTAQRKSRKHRRRRSQERFDVEWEKDDVVTACFVCATEFSMLKRKHHCRHCGRVICSDCSSFRRLASSRGKHRVCSYCSVEIANGGGRATERGGGAASILDGSVEASDSQQNDRDLRGSTKLRNSIVGIFSSKSTESRSRAPPVPTSSRKSGSYEPATMQSTSELFDTSDDTWFGDPVDHHGDQDKSGTKDNRHDRRDQLPSKSKDAYIQPKVIRTPDSLFDVQFTNGNHRDVESDDDARDEFAMPRPTSQSEISSSGLPVNDFRPSTRRSVVGGLDGPMTMDDLQASSASASYISSSGQYETALVVVPSITGSRADRTFYSDDADEVVADEAPGYYDTVVRDRPTPAEYSNPASMPMPRPSTHAAVSDGSSGVLVEVADISAAAAAQLPVANDNDRSSEGKGFTGALKRFFGVSKKKCDANTQQRTVESASHEKQPPPSRVDRVESVRDRPMPVEMLKPAVIAPAESDHYETIDEHRRDSDVYGAKHKFAEEDQSKPEHRRDTLETPLRHTMAGYVVPSNRADSLMRASVVGTAVTPESTAQEFTRKKTAKATRNRRDTFDDLFDLPANSTKAPVSAPMPMQSYMSPYGASASVGVARFDRPRRDDEDDNITRDLGLPANRDHGDINNRAVVSRTPWSGVASYRSAGNTSMYATPDAYGLSREADYHSHDEIPSHPPSGATREYDAISYDENGRGSDPKRTIMDDLKPKAPSSQSPRNAARHQPSLDDYFADFEKQTEYVFDSASGTYVAANSGSSRETAIDRTTTFSSQSAPVQRTMELREERLRAPTRSVELLEPVREDAPDAIDGIIADKISTLAGELEELKQLLRQRRVRTSLTSTGGASTASRKQSIFDSDGSDDEVQQRVNKPTKVKRKPSSKKNTEAGGGATIKNRRARKDSFADLFEDDLEESEGRQGITTRNYEALFQLGQDTQKAAGNSDDDTSDQKLSRRGRKRGSKVTKQRDDIDSESDDEARSRGHAVLRPSSRFNTEIGSEDQNGSSTWGDTEKNTLALTTTVEATARPPLTVTKKKTKRDAIDSLFDSDSDQDMGELYEATGVAPAPSVARLDLLGAMSGSDDDSSKRTRQDGPLRKTDATSDHSTAIVSVGVKAANQPSVEAHDASSDEEFSSTLKNLRGRRKPSIISVPNQLTLPPPRDETLTTDVATQDANNESLADQEIGTRRLSLPEDASSDDVIVGLLTMEPERSAALSVTSQAAVEGDQESSGYDFVLAEVENNAGTKPLEASKQETPFEHEEAADREPGNDSVDYKTTSDTREFDPLALLDDESEVTHGLQSGRAAEAFASIDLSAASTGWGADVGTIGEKLKAVRFRDSLLDDSPMDAFGPSTSLNLDDLFDGNHKASAGLSDDEFGEQEPWSGEDDETFSFEIKPKKGTSKVYQPASVPSEDIKVPVSDVVEAIETSTSKEDDPPVTSDKSNDKMQPDADVLDRIAEETSWGAISIASSANDAGLATSVDSAQFQDDWQRMQEQEKERKKRLQLKQRQAQRDKLKKQSSSGRSLGKSASTRGVAPPPTSPTSTSSKTEKESVDGSEHKKKKKNRKKADDENGVDDGDAHSQSSRRAGKRRPKRHVAQTEDAPSPSSQAIV